MARLRGGYAVALGSLLLAASLFLPGIKEALFPNMALVGWKIAAIGAAAVFDIGQDIMTNILASLFVSNFLFVCCAFLYPFLKRGPLIAAFWLCCISTAFSIALTLFFLSNTHFAIGHYLWLIGMCLVSWGLHLKMKQAQTKV